MVMKATERLFLNSDKTKVVGENDKDRASLLAAPGQDIPKEYEQLAANMQDANDFEREKKDAGKPAENKEEKTSQNKGLTIQKKDTEKKG